MKNLEGLQHEPENEFSSIEDEILIMAEKDQAMRRDTMDDPSKWDPNIDIENTQRIKEIIAEIGYPNISKVGELASQKAWLLIQHADEDIEFQKSCLELMKQEKEENINIQNIAFLEDRILISEGKPQLYGTQFFSNSNSPELKPHPITKPEKLNERRKEMNLGSFEEYSKRIQEQYK